MAGLQIGVPIETIVASTYESGSAVIIRNTRYDWRRDIAGKSKGTFRFFTKQAGSDAAFVRTNMNAPGMIENGRAFEVQQIAVKATRRVSGGSATTALTSYAPNAADNGWYDLVISTLFNYSTLIFRVNGTDHCGQYPLALFLPAVSNQGSAGVFTTGSTIAQAVIDLKDKTIPLSSLVNFGVELELDIPQSLYNGSSEYTLPSGDIRATVPLYTDVLVALVGKEVYSQR